MPRSRSSWMCRVFVGLLASLPGCHRAEPMIGTVAGHVRLDDKPVRDAVIVFEEPTKGISVNASIEPDGTFRIATFDQPGLPPGTYQVAVRPGSFGSGETPLVGGPVASAPVTKIPARYQSPATSGLTATVQAGENTFPFELRSASP